MSSRLRVEVGAEPAPGLLRPAIEAALAGRAWPDGPEAAVGRAVARVAAGSDDTAAPSAEAEPW